jgi:hypothetical protein
VIGAQRPQDRANVDEVLATLQKPKNSFLKVHVDQTVDIVHESLIWKWRRLDRWVKEEAAGADLRRGIALSGQRDRSPRRLDDGRVI